MLTKDFTYAKIYQSKGCVIMKVWQRILKDHVNIEVVDDSKVIVLNSYWNPKTETWKHSEIIRNPNGFTENVLHENLKYTNTTNQYESIYDFLGY